MGFFASDWLLCLHLKFFMTTDAQSAISYASCLWSHMTVTDNVIDDIRQYARRRELYRMHWATETPQQTINA